MTDLGDVIPRINDAAAFTLPTQLSVGMETVVLVDHELLAHHQGNEWIDLGQGSKGTHVR